MNATQTPWQPCSCGETKPHEIARRQTADGITVVFWSDGAISGRLGLNLIARPAATRFQLARVLRANALVADEACLYDWSELRRLVKTARRAFEQVCLPAESYVRRSMAGERFHFDGRVVVGTRGSP